MIDKKYYIAIKYYKKNAIEAAKDLEYGDEVIKAINEAEVMDDISAIMEKARLQKFSKEGNTDVKY